MRACMHECTSSSTLLAVVMGGLFISSAVPPQPGGNGPFFTCASTDYLPDQPSPRSSRYTYEYVAHHHHLLGSRGLDTTLRPVNPCPALPSSQCALAKEHVKYFSLLSLLGRPACQLLSRGRRVSGGVWPVKKKKKKKKR